MPDCPKCRTTLAMCEYGCICPNCLTVYPPHAVAMMPGYDANVITDALQLFMVLLGSGVLRKGMNAVEMFEDGLVIQHLGEPE